MAQVTEPLDALIVAHGSPSDPIPQEEAMRALAASVSEHLSGWRIGGATLAAPDALKAVLAGGGAPLVFPQFMANAWLLRIALPKSLNEAGLSDFTVLPPLGAHPEIPALCTDAARDACAARGWAPAKTDLILAAHGSARSDKAAQTAIDTAEAMRNSGTFRSVKLGYIEQESFLADAMAGARQAICLPFFATAAGHVTGDIPEAAREAGFPGIIADPIGLHPKVPAMIAAELQSARDKRAA